MCLFFLLASVALLLYPAKRETMFLRRLRYIPHMFLFRPHMFLFRMVAFESLFVSVAVGSLLSFLHKLAGSPLLCFWFTFIVPPQVGRPLPLLCFWFTFIVPPQVGRRLCVSVSWSAFARVSSDVLSQLNSVLLFYLTQTCKILLCTKFHPEVLL